MFIMLLLFSTLAFSEDMSSEKYCFTSVNQSLIAKQKFGGLQVPSDVVTSDEHCLMIQMRPHRRELIQRYMLSTFPGVSISFSSEEIKREHCILKVEKVKNKNSDNTEAGFNQGITLNQSNSTSDGSETMTIQTLKDFELSVDQDQIKGTCRYITPSRYEITIEVRKNIKPIVPVVLPPGQVVVTNQPPADQETSSLETQLQLNKGERIEIGEIVKKLKNKDNNININPSLNIETSSQNSVEKVFLSLQ